MIDSEIHVAIKSYRRAGKVKTLDVFPFAWVWVPESQAEEYRCFYPDRVISIPDEEDGNVCRKNNAILDRSPCPWTVLLDDDITRFGYWEDGKHYWCNPDQLFQIIIQGFILAADLGVKLWGVNQNKDELIHYTYRPLSLLSPILSPFTGHLEPFLRYDEKVQYKDDYDFWLQNILYHRKTLRFNKYHYIHDSASMPGGLVSMRTMKTETSAIDYMRKKWGPKVFKPGGSAGGKSSTGKNILNSLVKVPIPGC
jgi:hypothetical protein